jgi:hypothetical protein
MTKYLVTVDAVEWCGYNETYTVEADSIDDIDLEKYELEYAENMGLLETTGGWTEYANLEEDGELMDEDDVTMFSVTIREYDL